MNNINLRSIKELLGKNFSIPNYQRGYRWTAKQVSDLLTDIKEFITHNNSNIYCIQPLVVKRLEKQEELLDLIKQSSSVKQVVKLILENEKWEVIDGQQRLTTIYIILRYLDGNLHNGLYKIEYDTRKTSSDFLEKHITSDEHLNVNIDFYHMRNAYKTVVAWFGNYDIDQGKFKETLLERVKFIWYEVNEQQKPKEIFQRLNLGKIALTNAELIKAIFLKSNYWGEQSETSIIQISTEWDLIENALHNDEFWSFINSLDYKSPTRIDYIFDIIKERNELCLKGSGLDVGNDEYATFRYFYAYIDTPQKVNKAWSKVYKIYEIFNEWYNISTLYHYIGYIVATTNTDSCGIIAELIGKWLEQSNKEDFVRILVQRIISICKIGRDNIEQTLLKVYDMEGCLPKASCKPLLLLHNIETIVIQNQYQEKKGKYGNVFYRFPYNLYKDTSRNNGWDVEHIDSNTENELRSQSDRLEFLRLAYLGTTDEDIRKEIQNLLSQNNINDDAFDNIRGKLFGNDNALSNEEKNQIWNFALLDTKTNRGYKNAPFPAKRRIIIGKEQGLKYDIKMGDNNKVEVLARTIASTFIPPCTRKAFLKYYTAYEATNLTTWLREDANAYLENMRMVFNQFLKK